MDETGTLNIDETGTLNVDANGRLDGKEDDLNLKNNIFKLMDLN